MAAPRRRGEAASAGPVGGGFPAELGRLRGAPPRRSAGSASTRVPCGASVATALPQDGTAAAAALPVGEELPAGCRRHGTSSLAATARPFCGPRRGIVRDARGRRVPGGARAAPGGPGEAVGRLGGRKGSLRCENGRATATRRGRVSGAQAAALPGGGGFPAGSRRRGRSPAASPCSPPLPHHRNTAGGCHRRFHVLTSAVRRKRVPRGRARLW
jgi:hypothetical protein